MTSALKLPFHNIKSMLSIISLGRIHIIMRPPVITYLIDSKREGESLLILDLLQNEINCHDVELVVVNYKDVSARAWILLVHGSLLS